MDLEGKASAMIDAVGDESTTGVGRYLMGRMEVAVLLSTMICGPEATVEAVCEEVGSRFGPRPRTAVITTLDRLKLKGLLDSRKEDMFEKQSRGKKRLLYSATQKGRDDAARSVSVIHNMAKQAGVAA